MINSELTEWQAEEEGEPAEDEDADHDAERLGRLLLALELGDLAGHGEARVTVVTGRRPAPAATHQVVLRRVTV